MNLRIAFNCLIIGIFILALQPSGNAQDKSDQIEVIEANAEALVQKQLEAYNSKNLEAFIALFSDSVKVYGYPHTLRAEGKEALTKMFSELFENSGELHSEIVNRIVTGNVVIDQEKVTGFSKEDEGAFYVTAIYTTEEGLITEMRFIYP